MNLRLVILMGNLGAAAFNAALVVNDVIHGRWVLMSISLTCACVSLAAFAYFLRATRKPKEEQPSSPNPQPTSGTFQSQSPSLYLTGGIVPGPSPSALPSPKEKSSESQFRPRARPIPVVGFRSWHIDPHHRLGIGPGWRLASYNREYGRWEPGKNKAICLRQQFYSGLGERPTHHAAPAADCTCGFYVLTDFDKVPFVTQETMTGKYGEVLDRRPVTMMVGAVVGWGRVVQHGDEGWRAEKVQLIALLDCKVSPEHLRITDEVAESYGVPVLGRVALELLAKEYGDRLTNLEHTGAKYALTAHNEV